MITDPYLQSLTKYRQNECAIWRKNRLAARIIVKARKNLPLSSRDLRIADLMLKDEGIENYLLDQGVCQVMGRYHLRHLRWAGGKGPLD